MLLERTNNKTNKNEASFLGDQAAAVDKYGQRDRPTDLLDTWMAYGHYYDASLGDKAFEVELTRAGG